MVHSTEAGYKLVENLIPIEQEVRLLCMEGISQEDNIFLNDTLGKIIENLGRHIGAGGKTIETTTLE